MTNHELGTKLGKLILEERRMTNEILALINIALNRKSYLELGYSSMFDWLVTGFGYSSSAAFRRIEAARLLNAVPEAAKKLEAGTVNLTTLSRAQAVMRQQEKISGQKISIEKKAEIIEAIQDQSTHEAERTLISHFPEVAPAIQRERQTIINEHQVRHQMNLSNEAAENLKRAKEVLSHIMPTATDGDIVAYALKFLLNSKDPLRKPLATSAAAVKSEKKSLSKAGLRRHFIQIGQAKCSFKDHLTGKVCGSRHQLELDHIRPRALGGDDRVENLRLLCRSHNLLAAERSLGKEKMRRFVKTE